MSVAVHNKEVRAGPAAAEQGDGASQTQPPHGAASSLRETRQQTRQIPKDEHFLSHREIL